MRPAAASSGHRSTDRVSIFPNPVFDLGGLPFCGATADLDRDGKTDLVLCSISENGRLVVLLGRGDGTFAPGDRLNVGGNVESLLTEDFTDDRVADLVAVQDDRILTSIGKGDGSFAKPITTILQGSLLRGAATGDFNLDRRRDLAVTDFKSNTVELFLGRGDGSLSHGGRLSVGEGPLSVAGGDFNGDGRMDLVTANIKSHDLSLLLGRGQGRFAAARRVPLDHAGDPGFMHQHFVAAGDLDGDGRDDLVVSQQDVNEISVFLGLADGTLSAGKDYRAGFSSLPPRIEDVNGDGRKDIVVGNYGSNDVSVFLGDGRGSFAFTLISRSRAGAPGPSPCSSGTATGPLAPRPSGPPACATRSRGCPTSSWPATSTVIGAPIWRWRHRLSTRSSCCGGMQQGGSAARRSTRSAGTRRPWRSVVSAVLIILIWRSRSATGTRGWMARPSVRSEWDRHPRRPRRPRRPGARWSCFGAEGTGASRRPCASRWDGIPPTSKRPI